MTMYRVDPRIRAHGKARIDITRRAKDEQEWQRLWKDPRYPFPFRWGDSWKNAFQYQVDDYAAEVGFLIDVLGLPVYAFSPSSAIFTSPEQEFAISVVAAPDEGQSTPPDTLRIQFMVMNLFQVVEELERRGIVFEQRPQEDSTPGFALKTGYFRTPHGICIDLIGAVETGETQPAEALQPVETEPEEEAKPELPWQGRTDRQPAEIAPDEDPFAFLDEGSHPEEQPSAEDPDPFSFENPFDADASGDELQTGSTQFFFEEYKPEEPEHQPGQDGRTETDGETEESPGVENARRPEEPRRGDPFPRTNSLRRSSVLRGNGELRRSDRTRRSGGAPRKNPFSPVDLPPLPDFIEHRPPVPRQDNTPDPAVEDRSRRPHRSDPKDPPVEVEPETKKNPPPQEIEVEEQIKYEDIEEIEPPEGFDEFFS